MDGFALQLMGGDFLTCTLGTCTTRRTPNQTHRAVTFSSSCNQGKITKKFWKIIMDVIDFQSQISQLSHFNLLHLADFMHHWFSVSFFDVATRDGFRQRGALGHHRFWGPAQVWPIWPFVWKAWKCAPRMCIAPSKNDLLLCRLWFYDCLRSGVSKLRPAKRFCQ